MAKEKIYTFFSSLITAIHVVIVLLYIVCVFLLFLSKTLGFYAALFLAFVWFQHAVLKGCSLNYIHAHLMGKGEKKRGNVFFLDNLIHNLVTKRFHIPLDRFKVFFKGMLLFFFLFLL